MPAIDYLQLLKEEKQKRKRNKNNKQQQQQQNTREEENEDNGNGTTTTTGSVKTRNDDHDNNNNNEESSQQQQQQQLLIVPPWHCDSSIKFHHLDLKVICDSPGTIWYSPKTIDDNNNDNNNNNNNNTMEKQLVEWLERLPEGNTGMASWKTMTFGKRRVAMFGENEEETILPDPLNEIAEELVVRGIFPRSEKPNHVLCNDYQPSQGILPHTDGPIYSNRTATLSLGSDVVMSFTRRLTPDEIGRKQNATFQQNENENDEELQTQTQTRQQTQQAPIQVLLERGSLLVFEGDAYINYCHGIEMDVWQDITTKHCVNSNPNRIIPRARRFSLTFRYKLPKK